MKEVDVTADKVLGARQLALRPETGENIVVPGKVVVMTEKVAGADVPRSGATEADVELVMEYKLPRGVCDGLRPASRALGVKIVLVTVAAMVIPAEQLALYPRGEAIAGMVMVEGAGQLASGSAFCKVPLSCTVVVK